MVILICLAWIGRVLYKVSDGSLRVTIPEGFDCLLGCIVSWGNPVDVVFDGVIITLGSV